jgi:hypothetical protein
VCGSWDFLCFAQELIFIKTMSLDSFLLGTLDSVSPLRLLRGQTDVLRIIATLACEERWDLLIERFPHFDSIPVLVHPYLEDHDYDSQWYPLERQLAAGCAIATVVQNATFPPVTSLPPDTLFDQVDDILYINMMPFNLKKKNTLPVWCQQYLPLINSCLALVQPSDRTVGFLSIDERPAPNGHSQRRGGVHVESAGVLPVPGLENVIESGRFVPGVEHQWGGGMMTREESIQGGIFLGSNIADTTAVWNCHIRNDEGDFVGPHGSLERCRSILGPPTRTLAAGEIVWMTDKTPHESLPIPRNSPRRQFFRLVIGEVTAWFADHSTPNPTGFSLPSSVRVVTGNKYELYKSLSCKVLWVPGTDSQISSLKKQNEVRNILHTFRLGHVADRLIKIHGYNSLETFISEVIRLKSLLVQEDDEIIEVFWNEVRQNNLFVGVELNYEFNVMVKILKYAQQSLEDVTAAAKATGEGDTVENYDLPAVLEKFRELLKSDDGTVEDYW